MKIKILLLCTGLLALGITSCKEEVSDPPIIPEEIWECHQSVIWDEVLTRNSLLGTWQWVFKGCYFKLVHEENVTDQEITIEFKPDSTLIVRMNNEVLQESSWVVTKGNDDFFRVTATPHVGQIHGRILICNDRVEFQNGYIDGCNYHFERKG